MKKIVLIANRLNVLECLQKMSDVEIVKLYVLEGSLLDKSIDKINLDAIIPVDTFSMKEKARFLSEIAALDFDIFLSNGCPFILPVGELRKEGQLFINLHPTLLPDLKGKTPLNGVFLTHREFIGATMHYIDDGIDTGSIIAQKRVQLTPDIDQGLIYKISFDLEKDAFMEGWKLLQESSFKLVGEKQEGEGSYFNRTDEYQTIDIAQDTTDLIIDKIKSFNIRGQGTLLSIAQGSYRIYSAEKIVSTYLLERYTQTPPGEVAFEYDNKLVIKTMDGMIKLTDYEGAE